MDPTLGPDDLQAFIDSVVRKFLDELRLFRPPVDWVDIAASLPGVICQTENQAKGLTRKKAAAKGTVMLSDGLADEQNQRIAAQAIAHTLLPRIMDQMEENRAKKHPQHGPDWLLPA